MLSNEMISVKKEKCFPNLTSFFLQFYILFILYKLLAATRATFLEQWRVVEEAKNAGLVQMQLSIRGR